MLEDVSLPPSDDDDEEEEEESESEEEEDTASESLRWMLGTKQKNEELAKLKGEIQLTENRIDVLQHQNTKLRELLDHIPEATTIMKDETLCLLMPAKTEPIAPPPPPAPPAPPRPRNPSATTMTTRVFSESLALARKRFILSHGSTDLEPVWKTFAEHLEAVPALAMRDAQFDARCVAALRENLEKTLSSSTDP
jgi:hypothetical protein